MSFVSMRLEDEALAVTEPGLRASLAAAASAANAAAAAASGSGGDQ